jgi:hypothetical protein
MLHKIPKAQIARSVTSEVDRCRDQEIVTSQNSAEYCVTHNTQYKENYTG